MSTKRVNITLDPDLLSQVDEWKDRLGMNRSKFIRCALAREIERLRDEFLEEMHARGYEEKPVDEIEFRPFVEAQEWPDE